MGCFGECLTGIAKYLLFIFNFLILVAAVALLSLGIIYRVHNVGLDLFSVSAVTIAVGVIIALISFFGCCGAVKESRCLLTMYSFILITLFIVQVVLAVLAFLAIKNGDRELDTEVMKHLLKLYQHMDNKDNQDSIAAFQRYFECCGVAGPKGQFVKNTTSNYLIGSCCEKEYEQSCTIDKAYENNCVNELTDFIEDHAKIIGGICIAVAIVEIVGAVFAFSVRDSIARSRRYV